MASLSQRRSFAVHILNLLMSSGISSGLVVACCEARVLQAERKRENQTAKRVKDREERERRKTDTRATKEGPKRGGSSAPWPELDIPLALDDLDVVQEETQNLQALEVSSSPHSHGCGLAFACSCFSICMLNMSYVLYAALCCLVTACPTVLLLSVCRRLIGCEMRAGQSCWAGARCCNSGSNMGCSRARP